MRPLALAAALVVLVAAAAPAQFDKPVAITFFVPDKGEKIKVKVKETSTTLIKVAGEVKSSETTARETEYTEEVLKDLPKEPKGLNPDARRRVYTTAKIVSGGKTDEMVARKKDKVIYINRKNDKYEFLVEGKDKLSKEWVDMVDDDFSDKAKRADLRKLIPAGKVKVNDDWSFDNGRLSDLLKALDDPSIKIKPPSVVTGKLKKVVESGESLDGEVEIEIKSTVAGLGEKNTIPTAGNRIIVFTGTGCIDGKRPNFNSTVRITLKTVSQIEGVKVEFELEVVEERSLELIKK